MSFEPEKLKAKLFEITCNQDVTALVEMASKMEMHIPLGYFATTIEISKEEFISDLEKMVVHQKKLAPISVKDEKFERMIVYWGRHSFGYPPELRVQEGDCKTFLDSLENIRKALEFRVNPKFSRYRLNLAIVDEIMWRLIAAVTEQHRYNSM